MMSAFGVNLGRPRQLGSGVFRLGGPSAFTPAHAPSTRASNKLWLDADTITGLTDGSTFTGTVAGFGPAGSGAPIYRASAFRNGKPCLDFDGATSALTLAAGSALDTDVAGSFTMQVVLQPAVSGSIQTLINKGGGVDARIHLLLSGDAFYGRYNGVGAGTSLTVDLPVICQYVYDATAHSETLYVNGAQVGFMSDDPPSPASGAWFIGSNGSSNFYHGLISNVVIDSEALSPAQLASDVRYFAGRYSAGRLLVAEGDSRTFGADATAPGGVTAYPWPTQIATILGISWTVINRGVSSRTIADLINAFPSEVGPRSPFYRSSVAVIFVAVNDLAGGASASTTYGRLQNLLALHDAANMPYLVSTEPDSAVPHADYNALVVAGVSADNLVRFDLDSRVGPAGAALNTTYGDGSNLHWRGQDDGGNPGGGEAVFAELIAARIAPLRSL